MPGIPNSEPAPAAAHSPNSDEEIEEEVDSNNPPPIQECFLVNLNRTLHEKMSVINEFLTILILVLILIWFLYNHFSKEEGDLPDSIFQNLYKLLASACGVGTSSEAADDSNRECATILQRLNLSKNSIKFIIIQTKKAHMVLLTND